MSAKSQTSRKSADKDEYQLDETSSDVEDASSDVDAFSPDEAPKPLTKKRVLKTSDKPAPKRARRPRETNPAKPAIVAPADQGNNVSSFLPRLGELRLTASENTPILNKWMAARSGLQVIEEVVPNELEDDHLVSLDELPDRPGRDFKFQVELADVMVTWDPSEGELVSSANMTTAEQMKRMDQYYKVIKTWRLRVWNDALPIDQRGKLLRLFPEMKPQYTKRMEAFLRLKGDPDPTDRSKHQRRGGPLDISVCPTKVDACRVAAEACRLLNKLPLDIKASDFPEELDLSLASGSEFEFRKLVELMSLRVLSSNFDFNRLRYVFRFLGRKARGSYRLHPKLSVSKDKWGTTKYQCLFPCLVPPNYGGTRGDNRWPAISFVDTSFTEGVLADLPDLPDWWAFRYIPPEDMPDGLNIPIQSILRLVNYAAFKTFGLTGSHEALHQTFHAIGGGKPFGNPMGPFKRRALFLPNVDGIFVSTAVANTLSGSVPGFYVQLPKAAKAMAMQSAYSVWKNHQGILKTIEELSVSLQELYLGKSILSKETYCICADPKTSTAAHCCMLCLKFTMCWKMAWTSDARLICVSHFKDGAPPADRFLHTRIRDKANAFRKELSQTQRYEISDFLTTEDWLPGEGYRDAYDGKRLQKPGMHPLNLTIDAVFPLFKAGSTFFVHHKENVCLTAHFINSLKGDGLPIMLAALSTAVKSTAVGKYLPDIELQIDHFYHIRMLIPWSKVGRMELASRTPQQWWPRYEAMMKTGVFDGSAPIYNAAYSTISRPAEKNPWDNESITRISRICDEIEQSPIYNPRELHLPRGTDNAPWLWNPTHMFSDHCWEFLGRLFAERFRRMDKWCDWTNSHEHECQDTIFLTCVILWFQSDGGKDEVLGLRMSVFVRHPLRFSIGRALHVPPGSKMVTGWSAKHPVSLSQYSEDERTITMEPWAMNM